MKDILGLVAVVISTMLTITLFICTLMWLNDLWCCSTYIGAPTKMMGGACYAQQNNGKWVTFNAYVTTTKGDSK